jgi:phage-related protein
MTKPPARRPRSALALRRRRWRPYRTASGREPVTQFLAKLPDDHEAEILAGMADVCSYGLRAARHLEGDIWEVRIDYAGLAYRVLFAPEGRHGQVLLSLEAFSKKRQKTPRSAVKLARQRLRDWRFRGRQKLP